MGLLNQLWDDTVGGQQPDQGLGRLRKLDIPPSPRFLHRSESAMDSPRSEVSESSPNPYFSSSLLDRRRSSDFHNREEEAKRVTQSIAITKPHLLQRSVSESYANSSSPSSPSPYPMSPSVRQEENIWRSVFHPGGYRSVVPGSSKYDKVEANSHSPSIHDWINTSRNHPNSKPPFR
jgi:hypothetical protein